jgi:UDP:flavonoid glycosyltransferase YjiC (YdhE family)
MLAVGGMLKARGARVEFSSSDEVATFIERRGYGCNRLPLADFRYSKTGEFSLRATLAASHEILGRAFRQLGMELSNLERFAPEVVLSDSSLPTLLAAKTLGLPAFTVLNQLNLTSPHGGASVIVRFLAVGTSSLLGKLWQLSDEVLLPDLPPPYTISERNLRESGVGKTRYVGFLAMPGAGEPDAATTEFSSDKRPKVFWQVSGPPITRGGFLKRALECAEALADEYVFVVSAGSPSSGRTATRIPGGWFYGWCDVAGMYFRSCDLVVSRAGHGTIGQSITNSKPSLLVPIPKQPEQEGNAEKAARLGISLILSQDDLNSSGVRKALNELREPSHIAKARKLGAYASGYDARAEIVKTVEAAADRAHSGSH